MTDLLHHLRGGKKLSKHPVRMVECGCCEHHHREDYMGDCRNDAQRFLEHDPSDGEPDYTDADGERWISIAKLHEMRDA